MASRAKTTVRRPTQARSKATFRAILEAAAQVLRAEGLGGTTTARIAERAGVSIGTLYQYFPNKEAIYGELCEDLIQRMNASSRPLLSNIPMDAGLVEIVSTIVDGLIRMHTLDPELHQQLARFEAMNGFSRLQAHQDSRTVLVMAALGARPDLLRALDPELAAQVLILSFTGVVERWARTAPERLRDPVARREITALVAGYLAPENPVFPATPQP